MYGQLAQTEGDAYENGPAETEDRPVGVIEEKFSMLTGELGELERRINRLESRLSPILSPEMEGNAPDLALEKKPSQSAIASEMDSMTRDVVRMMQKVKSMTERIEL